MPKKVVEAHNCPDCGQLMERYGEVYTCQAYDRSHYGPYLERRKKP